VRPRSQSYPNDKTVLAVPIDKGLYRSTDGGDTWAAVPGTASMRPLEIRFSPNYATDQTFYAGTLSNGLVKFTNGGNKFSTITSFPDHWVSAVALSPNFASDKTMFAAGYWGLYKSTDAGNTWNYTAEPYQVEEFREVASHYAPQNPPSITYTGNWSFPEPQLSASTYEWAQTKDSNATAVFSFYGTGVSWISWTGPGQGSAAISLDGASQGTVNLNAATDSYQQNVYEQHGIQCGPHQFSITPIVSAGQTISIDAMRAWVSGCPQVPPTSSAKPTDGEQ